MKHLMFLSGVVLLMVLAMAADSTPDGTGANIAVESVEAIFGSPLQEPAMTSSHVPKC